MEIGEVQMNIPYMLDKEDQETHSKAVMEVMGTDKPSVESLQRLIDIETSEFGLSQSQMDTSFLKGD